MVRLITRKKAAMISTFLRSYRFVSSSSARSSSYWLCVMSPSQSAALMSSIRVLLFFFISLDLLLFFFISLDLS